MNQQQQQQPWPRRNAAQPQPHGRMKEQRSEDYAPDIDKLAGAAARRIIRETELEDTVANWRALKRTYLAGYEAGCGE